MEAEASNNHGARSKGIPRVALRDGEFSALSHLGKQTSESVNEALAMVKNIEATFWLQYSVNRSQQQPTKLGGGNLLKRAERARKENY
ncbi:hypothetical protein PoB_000764100 [Plakobranchus ocellatus]|uniref:Uncharacterized protein n=1 Tax=Plakobranchus ocellatus TaxID=259542 RepID=A0AAV3YD70_9GAST|nr:hypothetical protein PoB_000764100 [Plakobranchus ocellatus]